MSVIGTIAVNVVSKHQGFVQGMDQSRTALTRFSASVKSADSAMKSLRYIFGAGLGALAGSAVTRSLLSTADSMDELGKSADKLGIASDKLAGLHLGAELEGLDVGSVNQSLQQMTRRISELAKTGKGEVAPALKELGIRLDDIKSLSPDKQLSMIADRMGLVKGQSDKLRLAFDLFGKSGTSMVNLLKNGAAGLADYQKQAEALGIAIKRDDIAKVEEMNDALTRLGKALGGIKETIVIDIAPAASKAIDALTEAVRGFKIIGEQRARNAAAGSPSGIEGMFGSGAWNAITRALRDLAVRRQLAAGIATGTPAPSYAESRKYNRVGQFMAREPGFNPERVGAARSAALLLNEQQANKDAQQKAFHYLFEKGKQAGESWVSGITGIVKARGKDVGQMARDLMGGLEELNRKTLIDEISGKAGAERAAYIKKLEDIRKKKPTLEDFGNNPALVRGTQEAYSASRASDRVNKVLNEQLAAANRTARATEMIADFTKKQPDLFAGL